MYARPAAAAALLGATALVPVAPPASSQPLTRPAYSAAPWYQRPVVIAHRGASSHAPENTLPAVDKADRMGFDWMENDVQRTRDGELVIMHDATLTRTTDVEEVFPERAPWKVADFTAAEIARLDAGSWFDPAYSGTRVPTLRQYMNRIERNHQKLVLEIKQPQLYPGIEQDTLRVLRDTGWLDRHHVERRLVVQSFGADSVRKVHRLRPDVRTAFLGTPPVAELPAYAKFTDQINPSHKTISASYVRAVHALRGAHGRPLRVSTWTVDTAADARKVTGYGVDGIITNRPDVVRDAVRGRS